MRGATLSSSQLLDAMQSGALLRSKWKPRNFQKPKMMFILTTPMGEQLKIQPSAIYALIRKGKLKQQPLQSTSAYYLPEKQSS